MIVARRNGYKKTLYCYSYTPSRSSGAWAKWMDPDAGTRILFKWGIDALFLFSDWNASPVSKDQTLFNSSRRTLDYLFIYLFCSSLFCWLPFREDEKFNCFPSLSRLLVRGSKGNITLKRKYMYEEDEKGFHHAIIVCSYDVVESSKRGQGRCGPYATRFTSKTGPCCPPFTFKPFR